MTNENKIVKVINDDSTTTYKETAVEVKQDGTTHLMIPENEDLKVKAKRAGESVTDLVDSSLDKAISTVKARANELWKSGALDPSRAAAKKDSADIARLGPLVTDLVTAFESTITMVCKETYEEQVKILTGYKKLLEEQINVIDTRNHFVKRVR